MPAWDYTCPVCGTVKTHVFMNWRERDAVEPIPCPNGCEVGMERQPPTGTGAVFVGMGFYENDYKRRKTGGR